MTPNPNIEKIIDHCRQILGSDTTIDPLEYALKQKFIDAKGDATALGQKLLDVLKFSLKADV